MILLDAMMQLYRANYKLQDLQTRDGRPTGMEFGFCKSIEALRRFFKDEIILCWEGQRNFRYEIDPEYKANRRDKRKRDAHSFLTPDRVSAFREFLLMIAENAHDNELEADDIIASLAKRYSKTERVVIYSSDKDLHQLISDGDMDEDGVVKEGGQFPVVQLKSYAWRDQLWTAGKIQLEYDGITPSQFTMYQAFAGDSIDNIPGVERVSRAKIANAIRCGHTAANISNYELFSTNEIFTLEEHISSGRFDKNLSLVTLKIKDDINVIQRDWQPEKIGQWLNSMEFRSLKICHECGLEQTIDDDEEF